MEEELEGINDANLEEKLRLQQLIAKAIQEIIEDQIPFIMERLQRFYDEDINAFYRAMSELELSNRISESLFQGLDFQKIDIGLQSKINSNVKNINLQIQEIHKLLNNIDLTQFINERQSEIIKNVSRRVLNPADMKALFKPLSNALALRTKQGFGFLQIQTYIADKLKNSSFQTYVAFNAVMQYDGEVNKAIADAFDLDAFRYVGSLIKDQRPQCRRWVRKEIILRSELESELNWARINGKGLIPGTQPSNFQVFRGGYNCRHQAYPIRSQII